MVANKGIKIMVAMFSVAAILREITAVPAPQKAAAKADKCPSSMVSIDGRNTTITPTSPRAMATQRNRAISSPKKNTANTEIINGVQNSNT